MLNFLILLAIFFPFLCLTMLALIDVIVKQFKSQQEKVVWFIVASIPVFGCVIYFLFGRKRGVKFL